LSLGTGASRGRGADRFALAAGRHRGLRLYSLPALRARGRSHHDVRQHAGHLRCLVLARDDRRCDCCAGIGAEPDARDHRQYGRLGRGGARSRYDKEGAVRYQLWPGVVLASHLRRSANRRLPRAERALADAGDPDALLVAAGQLGLGRARRGGPGDGKARPSDQSDGASARSGAVARRTGSLSLAARPGEVASRRGVDFGRARRGAPLLADGIRRGGAPCRDRRVQHAAAGREHPSAAWRILRPAADSKDSVVPGNGRSRSVQPFSAAAAPAAGSTSVSSSDRCSRSLGALRAGAAVRDPGGGQRDGDVAAGHPYGWPSIRRSRSCDTPSPGRLRSRRANSPRRSRRRDIRAR